MPQATLIVRIASIERSVELLHDRLRHLPPSKKAEALHVRTHISVLGRCLKVLRAERTRIGKEAAVGRKLPKRRLNAIHQQNAIAVS
jgi:hypothetical protein